MEQANAINKAGIYLIGNFAERTQKQKLVPIYRFENGRVKSGFVIISTLFHNIYNFWDRSGYL